MVRVQTSPEEPEPQRRSRRSPHAEERQRDAERSRQSIIEAARTEFAANGFAGARVGDIAERAGLNKQLISYYFGGKAGLYDEVLSQWHDTERQERQSARSLEDLVAAYLRANHEQPELVRILMWEGFKPDASNSEHTPVDTDRSLVAELEELRRRQTDGELAPDLDAAYVLLALMGAVSAGTTMPHVVRELCGIDADTDEFVATYSEQLARIIRHLRYDRETLGATQRR